jgi:hypothetical protein
MGSHSTAVWVSARTSILRRRSSSLGIPLSEKAPSVKREHGLYPRVSCVHLVDRVRLHSVIAGRRRLVMVRASEARN